MHRIMVKGPNGSRMAVVVVRPLRFRRSRIVRAMARHGLPPFAIAAALRMSRRRVDLALGGNDVFDAAMLAAFRKELAA